MMNLNKKKTVHIQNQPSNRTNEQKKTIALKSILAASKVINFFVFYGNLLKIIYINENFV